jgi:GT2 family glycosyltransferase
VRPTAGAAVTRPPKGKLWAATPPAYAAGIVHYHAYAHLDACLRSLSAQTLPPRCVVVVDNDGEAASAERARTAHPEVIWLPETNRGFPPAANRILALAREAGVDFCLVLNPDVELEPDFARVLLDEMRRRPDVALAGGKLLRPDSGRLDSAGIRLPRNRRPRDRGSDEPDRGQFDRTEQVFGASGAALMLRCAALPDLALDDEVFDEDFFIYHEDTDLAWRANLLGWKVLYVPSARARHARGWRRERRFQVPAHVRRHSFKNHYLQILKNERAGDLLLHLPWLLAWEVLRLGYALLRDRAVLPGYREALALVGSAWRKRRLLQARARRPDRPTAPPRI